MPIVTRPATLQDLSSWLELAPEVECLFGSMPELETHLRRGVERDTALVVVSEEMVAGAALLSRNGIPHHINWLAVRRSQRRQGVGAALMTAFLDRWPTGNIEVLTFTAETPGGVPARRLYERFGLACQGATEPAPNGGPRDLFAPHRNPTTAADIK
jgi:GNAT superfamily N-acetyltransferase